MSEPILGQMAAHPMPRMEVPFARLGSWEHPIYGTLDITPVTFAQFRKNFDENSVGSQPYFRIGHDGFLANPVGGAPAVGWIDTLEQRGDVMYALGSPTDWQTVQDIVSGKYSYSSMECDFNYIDRQDGKTELGATLFAVGLTNQPFLTDLPTVDVKLANADPKQPFTFALDYATPKPKEAAVTETADQIVAQLRDENRSFLASLGTTLREIFRPEPVEEVPPVVELATTDLAQVTARAEAAERQLAEARRATHVATVEALCARVLAEGTLPAIVESLKPLLLAAPPTLKVTRLSAEGTDEEVSAYDQLVATLEAAPKVQLGQVAVVQSVAPKGQEDDAASAKQLGRAAAKRNALPGFKVAE